MKRAKSAREERRAYARLMGRRAPGEDVLKAAIRSEDTSDDEKALARVWLHFPDTRPSNVLARANALAKRRARNKVARAARKANRRGKR